MGKWTEADAPDLTGKTYIVTGANSGIGYEVTRMLAAKNAAVVMACRSLDKAQAAHDRLLAQQPKAAVTIERLDLSDLDSVRSFVEAYRGAHDGLTGLINNAGLMAIPRQSTAQGFEMQLGVNHLGHYALTAQLHDLIGEGRVVNVSSEAHRGGRMHFDDLMGERRYSRWGAYLQSKLANLLFTRRLQAYFTERGRSVTAHACHPGYASTELQGRGDNGFETFFFRRITNHVVAQSAAMGALPTLRAAVDATLAGGEYIGPAGMFGARGYPKLATPSKAAQSEEDAERLWRVSSELTGTAFA